MIVTHRLRLDLTKNNYRPVVPAVQGEANTRRLAVALFINGAPWDIPSGASAAVAFHKPDGTKGLYTKLPDGTPATTLSGNTVAAILAPQALTCAGPVLASIVFYNAAMDTLATFPFQIRVEANPAAGADPSDDYYAMGLEQLNSAYADLLDRVQELEQGGGTLPDGTVVPEWAMQPEKPTYTADEVGALSQDDLQDGVALALQQAKESGAFDGKDGDDYILTKDDKQEIANMIPVPEMPSGGNVVSVKDHGAIGDGVADDTAAIQAALDASHASGIGTVTIPNGVYLLSDAVKFYSGQHIIGEPGTVLLQRDGNTGGSWGNLMRNYYVGSGGYDATENVTIEGITFDGGAQEDAPATLLAFCHAKNITVRGCTFINGFSGGEVGNGHDIEVNSSTNVEILHCTFSDNRRKGFQSEIVQVDSAGNSSNYPWAPDGGSRNDDKTLSTNVSVVNCYFKGTLHEDVYSRNVAIGSHCAEIVENVVVSGCTIADVAYGVLFNNCGNIFVHGNYILNSTVGFYANLEGENLRFIGNILENCGNAYRTSRISGHGNMLNGVHFEEPESGGGGGIEVSGAKVGDFLKVKEVDEKGVPTAWETAEMPVGGEEWELITDFTSTEEATLFTFSDLSGFRKISYLMHYNTASANTANQMFYLELTGRNGVVAQYGKASALDKAYNLAVSGVAEVFPCYYVCYQFSAHERDRWYDSRSTRDAQTCCSKIDAITEIAIGSEYNKYTFGVGTRIILWGVKA